MSYDVKKHKESHDQALVRKNEYYTNLTPYSLFRARGH